jgi:hypothetical protein
MTDAGEVSSLLPKLRAFLQTLDEKERRMLWVTFYCASDPLDRMLMKTRLSDEEQAALARLDNGQADGHR